MRKSVRRLRSSRLWISRITLSSSSRSTRRETAGGEEVFDAWANVDRDDPPDEGEWDDLDF